MNPVSQNGDTCTGNGRCREQQQQQQQLNIVNRQRDSHIPTDNHELQQPQHSIQEEFSCCCIRSTRQNGDAIDTVVNNTVNLALDTVDSVGIETASIDYIDKSTDDHDRDKTADEVAHSDSVDVVRIQMTRQFEFSEITREDSIDGEDGFPAAKNREELRRRRIEENNLGSVAANYHRRAKEENKADRHERDRSYFWLTGMYLWI